MSFNKIEHIKQMITVLYFEAKKAHDYIFQEELPPRLKQNQEIIAGILLNKAIASYNSLHSFYYCNIEDCKDERIEDTLFRFDCFANEVLTNISTDHSHQWSNIEFERFKKSALKLISISNE
ncbi:hypothetical protein GMB34_07220 [Turicibacter sanguinis]|nr:hypothetical protein [Turicibacter sanguinis]MTN83326.1 hypothetical protein [Turicibacter sanguinis]MTN86725.1 hypothetical protein [Turicibacter sanguinis]MTN88891.1 hypothetical protein [Turicibacter sanguinis]MTN91521.1 hypothetical protein [Turicibacter sanguinis]